MGNVVPEVNGLFGLSICIFNLSKFDWFDCDWIGLDWDWIGDWIGIGAARGGDFYLVFVAWFRLLRF